MKSYVCQFAQEILIKSKLLAFNFKIILDTYLRLETVFHLLRTYIQLSMNINYYYYFIVVTIFMSI